MQVQRQFKKQIVGLTKKDLFLAHYSFTPRKVKNVETRLQKRTQ